MPTLRTIFVFASSALIATAAFAQQASAPKPEPKQSVEVRADRTVTFHFNAPNAKTVELQREGLPPEPMTSEGNGWWKLTTTPLVPNLYGYSFIADGVT